MPTDRELFFYEHAGYSYVSGANEAEQERARENNARELADAEETATRRGWWSGIEDDWDDSADGDAGDLIAAGTHERLTVFLSDSSSRVLASLGGVIVARQDDPYVRVVAAELARDVIDSHAACGGSHGARVTCGGCGRAWCGECDPAPSALCHWCHGRGSSSAEMEPADEMEEAR